MEFRKTYIEKKNYRRDYLQENIKGYAPLAAFILYEIIAALIYVLNHNYSGSFNWRSAERTIFFRIYAFAFDFFGALVLAAVVLFLLVVVFETVIETIAYIKAHNRLHYLPISKEECGRLNITTADEYISAVNDLTYVNMKFSETHRIKSEFMQKKLTEILTEEFPEENIIHVYQQGRANNFSWALAIKNVTVVGIKQGGR